MACQWPVLHKLRNWRENLMPDGHDRREPCGRKAKVFYLRVGVSRMTIELCGAHRKAFSDRGAKLG